MSQSDCWFRSLHDPIVLQAPPLRFILVVCANGASRMAVLLPVPRLRLVHQDPGMHPPAVTSADLLQPIQERLVILLPDEDLLSSISAGHQVTHRSRVLESQLPDHGRRLLANAIRVNPGS